MKALNIAEDGRIADLTRVVTAVILTEDVPTVSAKRLRAAVRAVRLYTEAGERRLADAVLTQIVDGVQDLPVDPAKAVVKHAKKVRQYWTIDGGVA